MPRKPTEETPLHQEGKMDEETQREIFGETGEQGRQTREDVETDVHGRHSRGSSPGGSSKKQPDHSRNS